MSRINWQRAFGYALIGFIPIYILFAAGPEYLAGLLLGSLIVTPIVRGIENA